VNLTSEGSNKSRTTEASVKGVLINLVRWYTRFGPYKRHKVKLTRWAAQRLELTAGEFPHIEGNLTLSLDLRSQLHRQIMLNAYERQTLRLIRELLRPGDTFVDGGANLGLMSLLASRRVGPEGCVYAFEPAPTALERLRRNLALNGQPANIRVMETGCWHASEQRKLHLLHDQRGTFGEDPSAAGRAGSLHTHTIQTQRIDEVVDGPVRLIKLDVEGAEWQALRGAEGVFVEPLPHLIIEFNAHSAQRMGYHPLEMIDWLRERWPDYRLRLIRSRFVAAMSRLELVKLLDREPNSVRNLWLAPA
jgi:FkbM family methyltransferase